MDNSQQTILVVDDDKNILMLLELYLKKEGFSITTCENGTDAVQLFRDLNPSLVLLDVMLPGLNGFDVLKEIRKKSKTPVIMLTAKGSTADRVDGLDMGADDYVAKPFDSKELIARIKAVLRRSSSEEQEPDKHEISFEKLFISMDNYLVTLDGNKIEMTPKETELLYFLLSHAPNVYTRDQLLEDVWEIETYSDARTPENHSRDGMRRNDYKQANDTRTVDVHIKRIREKLGPEYAKYIVTVWSVGYKFDVDAVR